MTLLRANSVFVGHNNRRHWCMHSSEIKYNVFLTITSEEDVEHYKDRANFHDGSMDRLITVLCSWLSRYRLMLLSNGNGAILEIGYDSTYEPLAMKCKILPSCCLSARKGPLSVRNKAVSVTRRNLGKKFRQAFDYFCIAWTHASEDLGRRLRLIVLIKGTVFCNKISFVRSSVLSLSLSLSLSVIRLAY